MPFILLLLAFLLFARESWAAPWFEIDAAEAGLLTIACLGGFVVAAAAIAFVIRRSLLVAPYNRYEILKRFAVLKRWHFIFYTAVFITSLYVLGWGWAVQSFLPNPWTPLIKPLVLAPFLIGLMITWAFYYDVDRAAHDMLWLSMDRPFLSRGAYLALSVRHNFMLLVPPLVLMAIQEELQIVFPAMREREQFPALALGVMVGLLGASAICVPWLLRAFLGLRSLPPGELRDHLTATAARLNFRFSDILVWDTRGTQANAMVTGLIPWIRYIVLTDRIIQELTVDEIEGVFGHEVGHVKHHHMAMYTLFLLLSLVMLGGLWSLGVQTAAEHLGEDWPTLVNTLKDHTEWFLLAVIVYVFIAFGLLSRNCERQADLFGCGVSSRNAFIRALEKVADINGMSRDKPGLFTAWQHWTIGQRVAFLRRIDLDPALEARTQRRIGLLKWSLTLALAAGIAILLSGEPWAWMKWL